VARLTVGTPAEDSPLRVDVDYALPAPIVQCELKFGLPSDPPEAKAPGWKLMGSYSGTNWETLAAELMAQAWDRTEARAFAVPDGTHYSKYRLELAHFSNPSLSLGRLRLIPRVGPRVGQGETPRLIIERYRGFNVYAAGEGFFALGCDEGPLDLQRAFMHQYRRFFPGFGVREVKWRVDDVLGFDNPVSTIDYSDDDFLGVAR